MPWSSILTPWTPWNDGTLFLQVFCPTLHCLKNTMRYIKNRLLIGHHSKGIFLYFAVTILLLCFLRGGGQGGKSPFSLLSEPISPSSLNGYVSFSPSSQLFLGHFSLLPMLFLPPHAGRCPNQSCLSGTGPGYCTTQLVTPTCKGEMTFNLINFLMFWGQTQNYYSDPKILFSTGTITTT